MRLTLLVIMIIAGLAAAIYLVINNRHPINIPGPTVYPAKLLPSALPSPTKIPGQNKDIKVTSPATYEYVKSPLNITGQARGSWFFEAVFPVKLFDSKGKLIAQTQAKAEGEWMTENFVPFTATLEFKTNETDGKVILEKDNPSGLSQNAAQIEIPVRFKSK